MSSFDLSPLFRTTIGFDPLMRILDDIARFEETGGGYPPYNIEKVGDQQYRITLAIAGFRKDDLSITWHNNTLIVQGKSQPAGEKVEYLHRGIAGRAFERRFQLADFIRVTNTWLENGLLCIDLVREVPESMKPRKIEIQSSPQESQKVIESN